MSRQRMSRRKFLQGALLTAAGTAAAACQPKTIIVTEEVEKVIKETVIVAQPAEGWQVIGAAGADAALSLDGFHEDGGSVPVDGTHYALDVVVRHVCDTGDERCKGIAVLFLPRRR